MDNATDYLKSLLRKLLSSAKFKNTAISEFIGRGELRSKDIQDYYLKFLRAEGEDIKLYWISSNTEVVLDKDLKIDFLELLGNYFEEFVISSKPPQIKCQYFDTQRGFDPIILDDFMNKILLTASIFGIEAVANDLSRWRAGCDVCYTFRLFINDVDCTVGAKFSEILIRKLENSQQLPDLFLSIPTLYDMFVFHAKTFKVPEKNAYLMKGGILEFSCKDIPFLICSDNEERLESTPRFKYADAWHDFDPNVFSESMVVASGQYVNTVFGCKKFDSLTQFAYEPTQIIERPYLGESRLRKKLVLDDEFISSVIDLYLVLIDLQDYRMREGVDYLISSIRPNFDHSKVKNKLNELQRIVDLRTAIEAIFVQVYGSKMKDRLRNKNRFDPQIEDNEKDLLVEFYGGASAVTHVNREKYPEVEEKLELFEVVQQICFKYVRKYLLEVG